MIRRILLSLGLLAAFTVGLTVDAEAATYGPRDLFIPADLPLPWVEGYSVCESIYVAERLRPTASGKSHIDVCRLKPRTVRFEMANGALYNWGEVLYPDEVNTVFRRLRNKLTSVDDDRSMLVMNPDAPPNLREVDVRNIERVNVVRTPFSSMELAAAPYFVGPAFYTPFVRIVGLGNESASLYRRHPSRRK